MACWEIPSDDGEIVQSAEEIQVGGWRMCASYGTVYRKMVNRFPAGICCATFLTAAVPISCKLVKISWVAVGLPPTPVCAEY
ncbi:MAG: hypothetical protein IPM82_02560 [Saprospiraceae bacterium]|nr:hypothetical protein [Saprospiraceae bacterium]